MDDITKANFPTTSDTAKAKCTTLTIPDMWATGSMARKTVMGKCMKGPGSSLWDSGRMGRKSRKTTITSPALL